METTRKFLKCTESRPVHFSFFIEITEYYKFFGRKFFIKTYLKDKKEVDSD
jgi:hypothetical protein